MDPLEYCRRKVAAQGSNLYYILLFQTPANTPGLLALYALEAELREVLEDCSQLQVAQHKLGFWVEELQRMLNGIPRHPVCQALAIRRWGTEVLPAELCVRVLQGFRDRLDEEALDSRKQLQTQCRETAGVTGLAAGRLLDPDNAGTGKTLQELAAGLELLRRLRFPTVAGRPLHTTVPAEELARYGLNNDEFKLGADSPSLRQLKKHLLSCAQQAIEEARQMIQPGPAAGFARAQARLALGECGRAEVWLRSAISSQGIGANTPLKKFWIAWRAASK